VDTINKYINERKAKNLYRKLNPADTRGNGLITIDGVKYHDFCSNDYLGLAYHPKLIKAGLDATNKFGTGSAGSRLLGGDNHLFHQLEESIAHLKGYEAGLIYNSGYQANVSVIGTLCDKADMIVSDKLVHASIIDGISLSSAKYIRFKHNDMEHLKSILEKERDNFKEVFIITESVFSMDGDSSPLEELTFLKNKFNCKLLVDEAHATGVCGDQGEGKVSGDLSSMVDICIGTFGKALGSFGAFVTLSNELKKYLINKSRGFIYSTALPPAIIAVNLESLNIINVERNRREILQENATYFSNKLIESGIPVKEPSHIIPIILGSNEKVIKLCTQLQEKGYWVQPIRIPTVPPGTARIRISLSYSHDRNTLEEFADALKNTINI